MRTPDGKRICLARRRSIFYLLDANALLREQFFRLGCWLSNRSYWNDSLRPKNGASGGIFSRGTRMQKRLSLALASVSRLRMRLNKLHVALL
jgi:hypothetical protein